LSFTARGPVGTLRGKVGMGVGLKERRFKEGNLGFPLCRSPPEVP
jgi:hypothetical protein